MHKFDSELGQQKSAYLLLEPVYKIILKDELHQFSGFEWHILLVHPHVESGNRMRTAGRYVFLRMHAIGDIAYFANS